MLQFLSIMIVSGVANYYIFIVMVFVIVAFFLLRSYYLKTSREVKRLEAVSEFYLWHALNTIEATVCTYIAISYHQDLSLSFVLVHY